MDKKNMICIHKNNQEFFKNICIKNENNNFFKLNGIVYKNHTNIPIKDACIKITDKDYNPICHCFSNKKGKFSFYFKFPKYIRIIVSKKNFVTYNTNIYNINQLKNDISIYLSRENKKLISILGNVKDQFGTPCLNIETILKNNKEEILYKTCSDKYGNFIFNNITPNCYKIIFSAHEYERKELCLNAKEFNYLYNLGCITLNKLCLKSTIHGIIKSEVTKAPVKNALVILVDNSTDKPLQVTRTNADGIYLFYNINVGNYYILAKE